MAQPHAFRFSWRPRVPARLVPPFLRPRPDGEAPFCLTQRRIYILPSGQGLLYALLLIAMLLTAINYSLALGHALVFLLAGIALAGMLETFRNMHGLWLGAGSSPPVFAGEAARFELLLDNRSTRHRPALRLRAGPALEIETHLDPQQLQRLIVPLPTTQRGWLVLPRLRLSTRYPLGLYVAWAYPQPSMRCLVYPTPIEMPLPAAAGGEAGPLSQQRGDDDFAGLRERQPADALNHVAWKIDARHDGARPLLIKEFGSGSETALMLDWALTATVNDAETRISMLTGWVLAAEAAGRRYALTLPDQQLPLGSGPAHRHACLQALALCVPMP